MKVVKACLAMALPLALALAASGCGLCPGCYLLNQAYKAIAGSNLPCHGPSGARKPPEPQAPGAAPKATPAPQP